MTSRSFSTLEQKIEWLLKNHIFLIGKTDLKKTVRAMKHDGLLSKLTYWPDAKTGVEEAIHQAKIRWFTSHNR